MIIDFSVTNFRSFKERQTFSMVSGTFQEHLKSNTIGLNLKGFEERLLKSSAIYGANAAGKTNLLRAIRFMQLYILNSSTLSEIPYSPFKFSSDTRGAPNKFEMTFIQNEIRYEYGFEINASRVVSEWLIEFATARGRALFERSYNFKEEKYDWKFSSFLKGHKRLWSESTNSTALFLSIAKQLNSEQLTPVFEWFQKRLVVIADDVKLNANLTLKLLDEPDGKQKLLSFMQQADLGITDLAIKREPLPAGAFVMGDFIIEHSPGQQIPNIVKVTLSHFSDDENHSDLELKEESNGTQIFFKTAGAWINIFKNGEILLVDEIEASLHPLLVQFLIQKFHSGENKQNSQLIFTTQSATLLDQNLLRRDQIWFVEKNRNGGSRIYPLTDFKPRNDEVLENWYLRGRYGALPILNS